jgi:hypothetical protein
MLQVQKVGAMTLSIKGLFYDTRHKWHSALQNSTTLLCVAFFIVMLSVIMLSVIMQSVIKLSVVMLSVVAPRKFNTFSWVIDKL